MGFTVGWGLVGAVAGEGIATAVKGAPKPPKPPLMADQSQVLDSQRMAEAQAAAQRQGRASTVLTSNQTTGDRLGP